MSLDEVARKAAAQVGGDKSTEAPRLRRRQAFITAIAADHLTATIRFPESSQDLVGIPFMHPTAYPDTGDTVWVDQNGPDTIISSAFGMPVSPRCRVYTTSATTINNASATTISFNTEVYDLSAPGMWAGGSPTRLTAPIAGVYHVTGGWCWVFSTVLGRRYAQLRSNGTDRFARDERAGDGFGTSVCHNLSADVLLAAGGYVELVVYQESTGSASLDKQNNGVEQPLSFLAMHFVGLAT